MNTLIIEDEMPAARQLVKLLGQTRPEVKVLETLDSVESSVRWLKTYPMPDLILMDIQIADGLSLDIFRQVDVQAPVVFTTAFDHYAVQAFRVNAVDYLLKPVDPEELKRALDKVYQQRVAPADIGQLLQYFQKASYKDRFLVKTGQQLAFLPISDIAYFRSSEGLTMAHTIHAKKYFIEHTLEDLERLIDPHGYFRISRGMLIGLQSIKAIHPHLNGRLKLELSPSVQEEVFVSRERVNPFKDWLDGGR